MNIIELNNITFRYAESEEPVFDRFSFSVKKGACIAIEGDNGVGKSTLFRILNGLSFAQSGTYTFAGVEINEKYLKDNRRSKLFHKQIGYLFQNPDVMLFNSTVYDEIAFGPRQMGLDDAEVDTRVRDCMELLGISELRGKAPYHLSGGQKKKVAMASIFSLNPEVLILDEPFAGMDRKSQNKLIELIRSLKSMGKTILIATHNPLVRAELADDALVLGE